MGKKYNIIPLEKKDAIKEKEPVYIGRTSLSSGNKKPRVLTVFLITASVLFSAFLIFVIPMLVKKTKERAILEKYEADMGKGELGKIAEVTEEPEATGLIKGFSSGNMIQGMGSNTFDGGTVVADDFGNIYVGTEGSICIYDKDLNMKDSISIKKGTKISHLNCVGNKLYFVITGLNKLGMETSMAASYDLGNGQITVLNVLKNNIKSTIVTFAVTNTNIFCTFLQGNRISVYPPSGQKEKYFIATKDSFTDNTFLLDADKEYIYYCMQGNVYAYNIKKKKSERIPSLKISLENRPFIYEGKVIYMSENGVYCNTDKIIEETDDIGNVNIFMDKIVYTTQNIIMSYDIKTKGKRKIGEDDGITDFYVAGDKLVISVNDMKNIPLR